MSSIGRVNLLIPKGAYVYSYSRSRSFSSPPGRTEFGGEPWFRVPAHVAAFSLIMLPAVAFFAYVARNGPTEESLESELKERYGSEIQEIQKKNQHMKDFLLRAHQHTDAKTKFQLDEVLKGGHGTKKRLYSIDDKLLGTAEGAAEKERIQEELAQQKRQRKQKRAKKAAVEESRQTDQTPPPTKQDVAQTAISSTLVTIAAVAAIAGIAGFVAGGRRSS